MILDIKIELEDKNNNFNAVKKLDLLAKSCCFQLRNCCFCQKQPSRGVLRKRCPENMQQIYRTPMPKCNFNKVALQLYQNHTSAWMFSCKFAAYFQNIFL